MRISVFSIALLFITSAAIAQIDQTQVEAFATSFADKHERSKEEVLAILKTAEFQPSIIEKITRPAEGCLLYTSGKALVSTCQSESHRLYLFF